MKHILMFLPLAASLALAPMHAAAQPPSSKALKDAQAQLNAEVLAQPFSAEEEQAVTLYISERLVRKLAPTGPAEWRQGFNCATLRQLDDYRDCRYAQRYYQID